jgi:hypothetical protein
MLPGSNRSTTVAAREEFTVGGELLPDLLDHLRIDRPGVLLVRLFLREHHQLDRLAVRPERLRIVDVEPFANGVGLGHTLLEGERVDGRHLDIPAKGLQPGKTGLEMLDRRQGDAMCIRGAAGDSRPEALCQLRRDAHHEDRRNVRKVIRPVAEVCRRDLPPLLRVLTARAPARRGRVRLLCVVLRAVYQHGREKRHVEVGRRQLIGAQVPSAALHGPFERVGGKRLKRFHGKARDAGSIGGLHRLLG